MRTRTAVLFTAVTLLLAAGVASPSVALSEQQAATRAVAGRLLVAPKPDALVKRLPARVVVRVPSSTTRLRVRLGRRDVSARFRRASGSLRVASLGRGDGLRYGPNRLFVLAERRRGRPIAEARSFVLARRAPGLVRLRVRSGPVTSVDARPAGNVRGELTVRLWLNGRRVTRALDRSRVTRWTARLSATHGLRHGVNRLRLRVVEPDSGRYALLRRQFVVRRARHLASAGWDIGTTVRGRVRLDGRRSRAAGGGRLDHRWRILSKPRGSRASLRRAGSARPLLTPDRRGRYVVGLTVRTRAEQRSASPVRRSSSDRVTVTAGPDSSLVIPFKGLTVENGRAGIRVGGTFYPNPSPEGRAMQWLTLDRRTLTLAPGTAGNSWLDGTGDGEHGTTALTQALSGQGANQLVILSFPYGGGPGPPVRTDQIDAFNRAIGMLGVGPIGANILTDRNKLVIVGVPAPKGANAGSGWYTHGGGPVDAMTGWLMPDAVKDGNNFRFRLQPERPEFDTRASSTATTNTMTLRDQRLDATLPPGATGGFQVALLDPIDLTLVDQAVFPTNGLADPASGAAAMAKYLNDHLPSVYSIAVQSIGQVGNPSPPENAYSPNPGDDAWRAVAKALTAFGANPHTFYTANGSYAFVGGTQLDRSEVAQSSSAVRIDPTPPGRYESGTLQGRLTMRNDGYFTPTLADATETLERSLYGMVFRDPTPWPYTRAAGEPQAPAYAAALSNIAGRVEGYDQFPTDPRQAYVRAVNVTWSDVREDLGDLTYPGDGQRCGSQAGKGAGREAADPGFSREQFCNLIATLRQEIEWLDNVTTLFNRYREALDRAGNLELVDLHTIGDKIRTSVSAGSGAEVAWSVGGFLGNMESAALVLYPTAEVLAAWEALVVVYELARELISESDGVTVGDEITSKVDDLSVEVATHLSDSTDGLDRLRDVILSDYGRLSAVGRAADSTGWNIDEDTLKSTLTTAAQGFFYTELMPIGYDTIRFLVPSPRASNQDQTTDDCGGPFGTHPFGGAPATGQVQWRFGFDSGVGPQRGGLWVLAGGSARYAPQELTDAAFGAVTQGGSGVYLPDFLWSQYKQAPTTYYLCR